MTTWERDVIRLLPGVTRERESARAPLARVMPVLKIRGVKLELASGMALLPQVASHFHVHCLVRIWPA